MIKIDKQLYLKNIKKEYLNKQFKIKLINHYKINKEQNNRKKSKLEYNKIHLEIKYYLNKKEKNKRKQKN